MRLVIGSAPVRPGHPLARHGHPQPHARLVLRPGRLTSRSTPFLRLAEQLVDDGADILDVGGVKAGPGPEVTEAEELERVVPAVEALRARFDLPLSVDTWRAVGGRGLRSRPAPSSATTSAASPTPTTCRVAPTAGAHGRRHPHPPRGPGCPTPSPHYDDVVADVCDFLADRAGRAEAAGIPPSGSCSTPGSTSARRGQQSLELLRASDRLAALGYPVLLSASNKRFLWQAARPRGRPSGATAIAGRHRPRRRARVPHRAGPRRRAARRRVCDVIAAVLEAA